MTAAAELEQMLRPFVRGELPVHLTAWDGSTAGPETAPRVSVLSPRALTRMMWNPGELGAAQAYVTEDIDVDGDLVAAFEHVWAVVAERGLAGVQPGPRAVAHAARAMLRTGAFDRSSLRRPPNPVSQARIRGRLHGLRRDRAVISHHYDLPSEFYRLVLDSRMTYSSGYFTSCPPNNPQAVENVLDEAQYAKLDMVCRKVGLGEPGATLLDVGCGWGALSIHAATHFGARVVGVTLSAEQKAFADKRIADLGLGDRVRIELRDYREIDGVHDAVASLEMGEHVGERQYGRYARTLRDAVVPGGRVLVQQMSREGRHPGGGPFIESFIAPDMTMRPTADTVGLLTAAGLELVEMQPMGPHYAHTVDGWIANFERNRDRIVALVGLEVTRVWQLYLAGGRTAFAQGRMGVDQILMTRPEEAS